MEIEQDIRYKDGKIYKIVCNTTGEIYYGSTISTLKERLSQHKPDNNSCISRNIIERGDYKIELIKDYPCNSRWELEEEERKYILENKCINITIPHRTKEEYYEDNKKKIKEYYENNKERILEKNKEWYEKNKEYYKERYEDNKEEILKYRKEYDKKNKEKILEKQKEYYENNKEKIKQRMKTFYENNKEKVNKKILCDCGEMVNRNGLARHKKSLKHLRKTECIIID